MKKILIIGAGRSSYSLIDYLVNHAEEYKWSIVVCDKDVRLIEESFNHQPQITCKELDVTDEINRVGLINKSDIVVSMLPAHMHMEIAKDCIALKKHMVTASYVSPEMQALDRQAKEADITIMNEIGVDPGIDHLSAMKMIDEIRESGGKMKIFESFTGGLLSPESEVGNPWRYKFTWNPRNVVLAGTGTPVKFIQEGQYKYIPHHQLFRRTEVIDIEGFGKFEGYPNRDSLLYREDYGLEDIPTIFRGTLRRPGYCRAWDVFVKLGMADDGYTLENSEHMTYREFTNTFLAYNPSDSVELKLMHYLQIPHDDELMNKLRWIGLFESTIIGLKNASPAQILEHILMQKWKLNPDDKDMIVMYHKMGYELNGENKMMTSSMVTIGDDHVNTAMAKTVGLPVAIAVKLLLNGEIHKRGVCKPIYKDIYLPMLRELEENNIVFHEKEVEYQGY